MLSLPRYILALVLWVSFFFNIERLHINKSELINIAFPVYLLATALLVVGLVLPQWRPTSAATMLVIAFVSFWPAKLLYGRPFWGDAYTYLTLLELAAVLVTATLAHKVGRLIADFVETLRGLFLADLEGRVHPSDQAEGLVKREMQSARRRNYPLSILLVEADTAGSTIEQTATAREVQRLLTQRLGLVRLTRLLALNLRPSDSIVEEIGQRRWLLMTSEVHQAQATAILQRLNDQTKRQFGIRLRYGAASFPEQGLTFEDLITRAEQDMKTGHAARNGDATNDATPISTEEPSVHFSSYESGTDR
jgi:GGDEF domain-containing protein